MKSLWASGNLARRGAGTAGCRLPSGPSPMLIQCFRLGWGASITLSSRCVEGESLLQHHAEIVEVVLYQHLDRIEGLPLV